MILPMPRQKSAAILDGCTRYAKIFFEQLHNGGKEAIMGAENGI
jgi:hypothetical protein